MDKSALEAYQDYLLPAAKLDLPGFYRGKVRDNYDLPGNRRLLVATDRLSAFDIAIATIPFKGQVLNQTSRFWFEHTADICPNHVVAYPDRNALVARQVPILPVEIIVRGYLAGTTGTSILTLYKAGKRDVYGVRLPDGMRDNQPLPQPLITPTSKAMNGAHDAPLTEAELLSQQLMTAEQWATVTGYALALFARGQSLARARGLILADTKYEFGVDDNGTIVLADEIHTPDSSRYWLLDTYQARFEAGQPPQSFDKDFIRLWVRERCDPYKEPVPAIPPEMILRTAGVYIEAFERITGQSFTLPAADETPATRLSRNIAKYLADLQP